MFVDADVGRRLSLRVWNEMMTAAAALGISAGERVLDLGCGDGSFANQILAKAFAAVDGYDVSEAAVARAKADALSNAQFHCVDLCSFDLDRLPRYGGAFLVGILHHIKAQAAPVVGRLAAATDKVVVLEPNGSHPLRKLLELTPTYRKAGEDSFHASELIEIFEKAGYTLASRKYFNIFPNFTPRPVYNLLKPLEPLVESQASWARNMTLTNVVLGFEKKA